MINNTINNPVCTGTKTIDYTDFKTNALNNTITLFSVPQNSLIVGMGCNVQETFMCKHGVNTLTFTDTLLDSINLNTASNSTLYQTIQNPFIHQELETYNINATLTVVDTIGSWSTGGVLSYGRHYLVGCGTQTFGLTFGGCNGPARGVAQTYDSTTWWATTGLTAVRQAHGGCGIQSAGLAFGGWNAAVSLSSTEEYNGSTWGPGGALSSIKNSVGGLGLQDAGLCIGGANSAAILNATNEYNGSTWSNSNDSIISMYGCATCGLQDAGLSFGGFNGAELRFSQEYNGTTWASGNSLIAVRTVSGGCGTQTLGLAFGGLVGASTYLNSTEEYDGTSWRASNNLAVPRHALGGCGTQSSGLSFGGHNGLFLATSEEYNKIYIDLNDLTSGSMDIILKYIKGV